MENLWPTVMSMGVTLAAIAASWGSLRQKLDSFISDHDRRHEELNEQTRNHLKEEQERFKGIEDRLLRLQEREKGN